MESKTLMSEPSRRAKQLDEELLALGEDAMLVDELMASSPAC